MESWMWILAGGAALAIMVGGFIRFKMAGKRQMIAKQSPEKEMAVIKNICRNKLHPSEPGIADKS